MNKREIMKFLKEDSDCCIIGMEKNIPIIACWRTSAYHVSFFCPECKKIHRHGWADGDPNGHRAAHCNFESRFCKTGYILIYQKTLSEGLEW